MRRIGLPFSALLLPALALAACGDSSPSGPEAPGPPTALETVAGGGQRATVGAQLPDPVVVRVLDDDGDPVPDVPVNFVVTGGGGSVTIPTALTGDDGRAQTRWTLGTSSAAAQTLEARVARGTTALTEAFTATAETGAAAGLAAVGAQTRSGPAGTAVEPLAVRVVDAYGNPVPGAPVSWSVAGGGGALSAVSAQSDAEGVARATWTLGGLISAPQGARARLGEAAAVEFTASATLPADAVVEPLEGHGDSVRAGEGIRITASVRTVSGIPISGARVVFASPAGELAPAASLTDGSGEASTVFTPPTRPTGRRTVTAKVEELNRSTSFDVAVVPGALAFLWAPSSHFTAFAGESATEGAFRVQARDSLHNAIPGVRVDWAVVQGTGSVSHATSVTDANGYATAQWQPNPEPGTRRIRATSPAGGMSTEMQVTVTPGRLARLEITPAGPITVDLRGWSSGRYVHFTYEGYDAYGNKTLHQPGPFVWTSSDDNVIRTESVAERSGSVLVWATSGNATASARVTSGTVWAEVQFIIIGSGTPP